MKRLALRFAAVAVTFGIVAACGDDDNPTPRPGDEDAGATGGSGGGDASASGGDGGGGTGSGGRPGSGGSVGSGGMTSGDECGGTECDPVPIIGGMMPIGTSCCTDDDECGIETPALGDGCFPRDQPGGADLACPNVDSPADMVGTLRGCCSPDGCGVVVAGLGCTPLEDIGEDAVACNYQEANDCTVLVDVPCDGPEDCDDGDVCCAQFGAASGTYDSIGCMAADECASETSFEMCHATADCPTEGDICAGSSYLPPTLARCFTLGAPLEDVGSTEEGEVNCGEDPCGDGEKCCLRPPNEPYCAPADADCTCVEASAVGDGGTEGGAEAGASDGGADAAASDASTAADATAD